MTLTALLLVGGESRRMGRDKATVVLDGEPLWQRQLRLLRQLQPQHLWISARARPVWCPAENEVVLDEPPSRGPLSGITSALSRLQSSHLLTLAIDMPYMRAGHLQTLLALAHPSCGVVPVNQDLFEPLCAVYPAEACVVANEALQQNQLSLQDLIRVLLQRSLVTLRQLNQNEKSLYYNANEPEANPQRSAL